MADPARPRPLELCPSEQKKELSHPKCGFLATPAVGRLEGPGKALGVVAPGLDGRLYAYRADGSAVPGFPVRLIDTAIAADRRMTAESINNPAVGDLNGDGRDDVVVPTNEVYGAAGGGGGDVSFAGALGGAVGTTSRVYAVDSRGRSAPGGRPFLAGWPIELPGVIQNVLPLIGPGHDPALVKLDGAQQVVVSTTGGALALYDARGAKTREINQNAAGEGALNLFESAAVGDVNGNGPEIVKYQIDLNQAVNLLLVGQNVPYSHRIGVFDASTGQTAPGYPVVTDDYQFLSSSTVARVSPGAANHVVAGTGLGLLHAYDGITGRDAPGFPKVTGGWLFAPAALSDDRRAAAITREGFLFVWNVPDTPACQSEWPSFRHDQQGTGNYDADGTPPGAPDRLSLTRLGGRSFRLVFRSPGDDGLCGTAARYLADVDGRPLALGDPVAGGTTLTRTVELPRDARRVTVRAADAAAGKPSNLGAPGILRRQTSGGFAPVRAAPVRGGSGTRPARGRAGKGPLPRRLGQGPDRRARRCPGEDQMWRRARCGPRRQGRQGLGLRADQAASLAWRSWPCRPLGRPPGPRPTGGATDGSSTRADLAGRRRHDRRLARGRDLSDRSVDFLLIGGGIASAACAQALREEGADGSIMLVGREPLAPYHRPPVSKGYLRGEESKEDVLVHPEGWWADNDVELVTSTSVMSLDTDARVAKLSSKEEVGFGKALVATGAMVRRLRCDGGNLDGIHYLRALGNADAVAREVEAAERVVLIGGSYIGCEVAASLTELGKRCTIVMQESVALERSFGKQAGSYIQGVLEDHGVDVVGDEEVVRFEGPGHEEGAGGDEAGGGDKAEGGEKGETQAVARVVTAGGRELAADAVVPGVGAIPDVMLAKKAGLELGERGGVKTDRLLETSVSGIYAAGDMCEYESVVHGATLRIEHEDVAQTQGRAAALNMLGAERPYDTVPYFFSDLSDWLSLEYVGPALSWDDEVVRGATGDGSFSVWYLEDGVVRAVLSVNGGGDLDHGRRLIRSGDPVAEHREALSDPSADLSAIGAS